MPEVNKANRQVCDLYIDDLSNGKPFLDFDTANVTTVGLSGDAVYATAKGARRISFPNPFEGTMTVEAQVYPFKYFALFSDGVIENNAVYSDRQVVTCATKGKLTIDIPSNGVIDPSSVFVAPVDEFGNEDALIAGSYAANGTDSTKGEFTADTTDLITQGEKYKVGYIVNRQGVKKVSFNNKKSPKDFRITMCTLDKDENGVWTPFRITAYKATAQKNFELSFSSDGDPATVTVTFDIMEDKDGNVLDFVELTEQLDVNAVAQVNDED